MNKKGSVLVIAIATIAILAAIGGGYLIYNNYTNPSNFSDRYIDNGDGSITDTSSNLIWTKCDVGNSGDLCDESTEGQLFSINYVANSANTRPESADWVCANSVLCKDKTFQYADPEFNKPISNCPTIGCDLDQNTRQIGGGYLADKYVREEVCINHGGISRGDWNLPSAEELKTLHDVSDPGISWSFFPNSALKLLALGTPDGGLGNAGRAGVVGWDFIYNVLVEDINIASLPMKCVSKSVPQSPGSVSSSSPSSISTSSSSSAPTISSKVKIGLRLSETCSLRCKEKVKNYAAVRGYGYLEVPLDQTKAMLSNFSSSYVFPEDDNNDVIGYYTCSPEVSGSRFIENPRFISLISGGSLPPEQHKDYVWDEPGIADDLEGMCLSY